jgi:hypothetical protein
MVVLDRATTDVVLSNTAAETTMYTYSVPANMGARPGQVLDLEMIMTLLNNSGANRTYTVRIKFGGTTHFTEAFVPAPTSIFARPMVIRVRIQNESGSNQYISATVFVGPTGNDLTVAALIPPSTLVTSGTIDQTAAQTLAVTLQSDAATATQTITTRVAQLELK